MTKDETIEKMRKFVNIGIYFCFLIILLVCINEKTNYHMDEISTYILANNTYDETIVINPELNVTYDNPEEVWLRNMTVQPGESFNYKNVWEKQMADGVHPPFYYVLIHTICSFMPGIFSKWAAGSVNIFFAICTLFVLRKLLFELTGSELARFMGSCCYIFSAGCLSAITFFRMYVMLTFLVVLISFVFLKGMQKREWEFWLCTGILSVTGALTHYYFIFYLFFISLTFGVFLLKNREWRDAVYFVLTMVLSGIICLLIFPSIIVQTIGGGYRGAESLHNFKWSSFEEVWIRLQNCFQIVDSQLFGGMLLYYAAAGIAVLVIGKLVKKDRYSDASVGRVEKWILLGVPTAAYFLLVSKIAVYITDRYFHPIYPLLIILITGLLTVACKRIFSPRISFVILSILLGLSTLKEFKNNWFYLYRHSSELLTVAASHGTSDCLFFINNKMDCNAAYNEARLYESVTFVSGYRIDMETLKGLSVNTENGLVIAIGETCDGEKVLEAVKTVWPQLKNSVFLGRHSASYSYYFYE